jgi:hypothetical protein
MQIGHYLALLHRSQCQLGDAFRAVAEAHHADNEVARGALRFASRCEAHAEALQPFVDRYAEGAGDPPSDLHTDLFHGPREGPLALLRDLHDLYLMAAECDVVWTLIGQAAQGARDRDLFDVVQGSEGETAMQMRWTKGQMKHAAPQSLVVSR